MAPMLEGQIALITGAASGIGRAIALAASREGASLVLGDVQKQGGEELAKEICDAGGKAYFRYTNVESLSDLEALVEMAVAKIGAPDVVFANAGIEGPLMPAWQCDENDFLRVLNINLVGVWRTMRAVLPAMLERKSGSIVATSSVAGLVGAGGIAPYVSSKHGVVGLVKSVAIDVAKNGIRVNAVCPGMIETGMVDRLATVAPGFRESLLALKPMGRLGVPEEVAEAAIWLSSKQASFITGHALVIDGGYTSQ